MASVFDDYNERQRRTNAFGFQNPTTNIFGFPNTPVSPFKPQQRRGSTPQKPSYRSGSAGTGNVFGPPVPKKEVPDIMGILRGVAGIAGDAVSEAKSMPRAPSLADILAQYGDGSASISGILSGFANQKADAQRRANLADSAISGFYDKAIGEINQGADSLNKTLGGNIDAANTQAQGFQGALTDANAASKAQRDAILANLGLTGTVDDSNRDADVAARKGDAAAYSTADLNRMRSDQNTAVTSQRGAATSAGLRQAEERTLNQSNLQSILAELADRETQARASAAENARSQALQMYGMLRGEYESDRAYRDSRRDRLDDRAYSEARDAEAYRREQELAMLDQDPSMWDNLNNQFGQSQAQGIFDALSGPVGGRGTNTAVSPTIQGYLQQVRRTPQYMQASPAMKRAIEQSALQFFNENKLGG